MGDREGDDWSSYERPGEQLDETGAPTLRATGKKVALLLSPLAVAVALIVGAGLLDRQDVGGFALEEDPVDRSILDAAFLDASLDEAAASFGADATGVRLDQFALTVEYVDPETQAITFVAFDPDMEGYRVDRLEPRDHDPSPFDLTLVSGDELVSAADAGLDRAEDPYEFVVEVTAGDAGDATALTTVRDDGVEEPIESTLQLS